MDAPLDILAFAPHPDDAEIGCAGSLILAVRQGQRVAVADLTAGEGSSRGTLDRRKEETAAASAQLGLCARFALGLPDMGLTGAPEQRLPLINLIRATRPRIVLAPYPEDRHPDHAAAGRLVADACHLAGVAKAGSGSPHRPERLYYYMLYTLRQPFMPSFVLDVSAVWEQRLAALQAYRSQFSAEGGGFGTVLLRPEFERFITVKAAWFGAQIGVPYGEPFYTPGPVALDTFPGLLPERLPPGELPGHRLY
jgi:bacillithiol biosynthesis deacetylase BshB1